MQPRELCRDSDGSKCDGTATFSLTNAAAQIGTTLTLSTSSSDHGTALPSNDALAGNPVTVSFKVAQTSGSATPTGNVVVSDGLGDTCAPSPVDLTSASAGAGSCTINDCCYRLRERHADRNVHSEHKCF